MIYILPECCEKLLLSHGENVSSSVIQDFVNKNVYQLYELEIENATVNGRAHYTSDDGTRGLWSCSSGLWLVGHPDSRYQHLGRMHNQK